MKSLWFIRGVGITGAVLLTHAATALAAGTTTSSLENTPLNLPSSSSKPSTSVGGGTSITRTIIGLLIVVAVIYGISWLLKRAKRKGTTRAHGTQLNSVASLPLGPGRSVQLVRAGNELLLLGVAEQGVTTLRRYTEAEAIEAGLAFDDDDPDWVDPAEPPASGVVQSLRRLTVRS